MADGSMIEELSTILEMLKGMEQDIHRLDSRLLELEKVIHPSQFGHHEIEEVTKKDEDEYAAFKIFEMETGRMPVDMKEVKEVLGRTNFTYQDWVIREKQKLAYQVFEMKVGRKASSIEEIKKVLGRTDFTYEDVQRMQHPLPPQKEQRQPEKSSSDTSSFLPPWPEDMPV
jgi:septation ring formation regulator EzrA